MNKGKCEIGVIGLGVMGRNLVRNIADHDHWVAGLDTDPAKVAALRDGTTCPNILAADSIKEFVDLLASPKAALMLVPAGPPVDTVVRELVPLFKPGDIIIDAGNSHFRDTDLRAKAVAVKGIHYLGVGVSGGERGAHYGPSLMPGGPREAYDRVRPILEDIAAKAGDDPCVRYLGPGSAGHYVKMVHNGIEYGLMELIAETYDLMKRGLGFDDDQLHGVYDDWNKGELAGFLLEITATIFCQPDDRSQKRLIDVILDEAKQKGTGKWTVEDALDMQVPTPTICESVCARDMSAHKAERAAARAWLGGEAYRWTRDPKEFVGWMCNAYHASLIITFAQGFAQLGKASTAHGYGLKLEDIAAVWRGECIIRSAVLEDIRQAFEDRPDLPNLLLSDLGRQAAERQGDLRRVASASAELGIPVPAFTASLGYFDSYRSAWLPANLTQAQRDYFGSHTYERIDAKGAFHTVWEAD
jgi:6-phosphogluconate dehydrogenase